MTVRALYRLPLHESNRVTLQKSMLMAEQKSSPESTNVKG
jgi:hypothetical protein